MTRRFTILTALAATLATISGAVVSAAPIQLLNVSYDPTREL